MITAALHCKGWPGPAAQVAYPSGLTFPLPAELWYMCPAVGRGRTVAVGTCVKGESQCRVPGGLGEFSLNQRVFCIRWSATLNSKVKMTTDWERKKMFYILVLLMVLPPAIWTKDLLWAELYPPTFILKPWHLLSEIVTVFGDHIFKNVIKLKVVVRLGPNPIGLVSL